MPHLIITLSRLALKIALFASVSGAYAQVILNLTAGWNLLGNSSDQVLSVSSPTIFGDPSRVTSVWMWDATNAHWLFYSPEMSFADLQSYASSKGYRVLGQISPGDGFWVNAKTTSSLALQNSSMSGIPMLATGWNLMTTGSDVSPSSFVASQTTADITSIWAWDNSAAKWFFYAPSLDAQGKLNSYVASNGHLGFADSGKTLGDGVGFWVSAVIKQTDPACDYVKPATIMYPPEYNGSYQLPTPTQELPTNIKRSIGFKDYSPSWYASAYGIGVKTISASNSCVNYNLYAHNLYVEDLNRIKKLGADHVWIYNYGDWDDFTKQIWTINKSDYSYPESEFKLIIDEAKKRNIEVNLNWQFSTWTKKGQHIPMNINASKDDLTKMLDSFRIQIVDQARYGNQIGLAGIAADWGAFSVMNVQSDPELRELYITKMTQIIADIRGVFSGKVYYGSSSDPVFDYRILSKIDSLILTLYANVDSSRPLSVDLVKDAYIDSIRRIKESLKKQMNGIDIDIPISWDVLIQSKNSFYSTGWTEDGFCSTSGENSCIQKTYVTDFSVQALGWESVFEAINSQSYFRSNAINVNAYWHTDDLAPIDYGRDFDFPNLSQSIRNKPAENIVKYWFNRDGNPGNGYGNDKFIIRPSYASGTINLSFTGWFSSSDNGRTYPIEIFLGTTKVATSGVAFDPIKSAQNPSGYWSDSVSLTIPIPIGSDLSQIKITMPGNDGGFIELRELNINYFGYSVIDPSSASHSIGAMLTGDKQPHPQWIYNTDVTTYDLTSLNLSQRTTNPSGQFSYIDGGDGTDTIEFDPPQSRSYFQVKKVDGLTVITDLKGTYPEVRMKNVEWIKFADGAVAVQ